MTPRIGITIQHAVQAEASVATRLAATCAKAACQVLQRQRIRVIFLEGGDTATFGGR